MPTSVLDLGLADRATAAYDPAIAIERFAVDWAGLRAGGPANIPRRRLQPFLRTSVLACQDRAAHRQP